MSSAPSSSAARSPTSRLPTRFVRWASSGQTSIPCTIRARPRQDQPIRGQTQGCYHEGPTPCHQPWLQSKEVSIISPSHKSLAYPIVSTYSHAYLYTVDLPPMTANATVNLVVDSILSHASTPFPATIKQSDPQRLKFEVEALVLTPYPTSSQRIKIRLVLRSVEHYFRNSRFASTPTPNVERFSTPKGLLKYSPEKDEAITGSKSGRPSIMALSRASVLRWE
jgi:hypothetical protein